MLGEPRALALLLLFLRVFCLSGRSEIIRPLSLRTPDSAAVIITVIRLLGLLTAQVELYGKKMENPSRTTVYPSIRIIERLATANSVKQLTPKERTTIYVQNTSPPPSAPAGSTAPRSS